MLSSNTLPANVYSAERWTNEVDRNKGPMYCDSYTSPDSCLPSGWIRRFH